MSESGTEGTDTREELARLIERGLTFGAAVATFAARQRQARTDYAEVIAEAERRHGSDGEVEIDEDAILSESKDGGDYVMAWVWVPHPENEDGDELAEIDLSEKELDTMAADSTPVEVAAPRVQVLHYRHPDQSSAIRLYLDGVEVAVPETEDIDPGAGYESYDYAQRLLDARERAGRPDATQFDRDVLSTLEKARTTFRRYAEEDSDVWDRNVAECAREASGGA